MGRSTVPQRFSFAASDQMHGATTIDGVSASYCGVEIPEGAIKVATSPTRPKDPPLCQICMMAGLLASLNVLPRTASGG